MKSVLEISTRPPKQTVCSKGFRAGTRGAALALALMVFVVSDIGAAQAAPTCRDEPSDRQQCQIANSPATAAEITQPNSPGPSTPPAVVPTVVPTDPGPGPAQPTQSSSPQPPAVPIPVQTLVPARPLGPVPAPRPARPAPVTAPPAADDPPSPADATTVPQPGSSPAMTGSADHPSGPPFSSVSGTVPPGTLSPVRSTQVGNPALDQTLLWWVIGGSSGGLLTLLAMTWFRRPR